ncbi:ribosome biogenesis GTPase Der protein, partial [Cardiosporidium cionae]
VSILCVDALLAVTGESPSPHDLTLGNIVTEKEGRCLVVAVTKWDALTEKEQKKIRLIILQRIEVGLAQVKGCPVIFTSGQNGENLNSLIRKSLLLHKRWTSRISTSKLNAWLQAYLLHFPPPWRLGSRCNLKYITQVSCCPPTFVMWTNVMGKLPLNYIRQIRNVIREEFSLQGSPIRLIVRTTAMPPKNIKLSRREQLKWRRRGPKQAEAVHKLTRRGTPRQL